MFSLISQVVQAHEVQFLLAGGHAVILHGFPRNTFDLDLIVRRSDRDEWLKFLADLGYSPFSETPNFLQFNNSDEKHLPLDLMFVTDATFQNLFNEAVAGPEKNTKAVSLLHLLALNVTPSNTHTWGELRKISMMCYSWCSSNE